MLSFRRTLTTLLCSLAAATTLSMSMPSMASADTVGITFPLMAPVLEGKLNLNTASQKQLEMLPGVGPATAKRIVAYRSKHAFREAIHVMRVKGVGRKTYDRMRSFLTVKGETTLSVVGKAKGRK